MRVGIEVGGTFTDLVAIGPDGIHVTKVPSVPRAPDEGAFNALVASGIAISSIEDLAHGSTVATNAVLERKGFPTAFVTTQGFRDILALQRHGRSRIYDLEYQKPKPVVTRAGELRGGRAHPRRRHDRNAAGRCRCRRAPGAGAEGRRLRGGRHLPAQFLRQSGAREGAARPAGRGAAGVCTSPSPPTSRASSASTSAPRRPRCRPTCSRSSTDTSRASGSGSRMPASAAASR